MQTIIGYLVDMVLSKWDTLYGFCIGLGCSDCGNKMMFKFHPGAFGLTAKNHWSCCGGAREATGCSICSKAPEQDQPESQPSDKPSTTLPEKQSEKQQKEKRHEKQQEEVVSLTSSIGPSSIKPEAHVMYLNPLKEPPTTETKVNTRLQGYNITLQDDVLTTVNILSPETFL